MIAQVTFEGWIGLATLLCAEIGIQVARLIRSEHRFTRIETKLEYLPCNECPKGKAEK